MESYSQCKASESESCWKGGNRDQCSHDTAKGLFYEDSGTQENESFQNQQIMHWRYVVNELVCHYRRNCL